MLRIQRKKEPSAKERLYYEGILTATSRIMVAENFNAELSRTRGGMMRVQRSANAPQTTNA